MRSISLKKIESIEFIKGLGLILAAFQHLRFFLPQRNEQVETIVYGYFQQPNLFYLFMRVSSHVIVTAFFVFAGMNIELYRARHVEVGTHNFLKHFFTRAGILLLLEVVIAKSLLFFLKFRRPDANFDEIYLIATTFSTFAFIFITIPVLSTLDWVKRRAIWLGLCIIILGDYLLNQKSLSELPSMEILLLSSGWINHQIYIAFPLIPWLGVSIIGYGIAVKYLVAPTKTIKDLKCWGLICIAIFLALRFSNTEFANLRSDFPQGQIRDYFFMIKHPPSLTFLFFTFGMMFLTMAFLEWLQLGKYNKTWPIKVLALFSRNGVFFYVAHFYVCFFICAIFFKERTNSTGARIAVWLSVLTLMYFACRAFEKASDSIRNASNRDKASL